MIWLLVAYGDTKKCDSCGEIMVIRSGRFVCPNCEYSS